MLLGDVIEDVRFRKWLEILQLDFAVDVYGRLEHSGLLASAEHNGWQDLIMGIVAIVDLLYLICTMRASSNGNNGLVNLLFGLVNGREE